MVATKLEKGGIYNHFANKEAFLFAVQKIKARYSSLLAERADARSKLRLLSKFCQYHYRPSDSG